MSNDDPSMWTLGLMIEPVLIGATIKDINIMINGGAQAIK